VHRPQPAVAPPTLLPPKAPDPRPCQGQTMARAVQMRSERGHTTRTLTQLRQMVIG
jgi:hypothetical protein